MIKPIHNECWRTFKPCLEHTQHHVQGHQFGFFNFDVLTNIVPTVGTMHIS